MFKYRKEKRDEYIGLVTEMYFNGGSTIAAISRKISTPSSTVRRWIRIFAEENCIEMAPRKHRKRTDIKHVEPEAQTGSEDREKALLAEIKRLEMELKREKLRADLNDEIINVAEQKFNIQIRKKAGARR